MQKEMVRSQCENKCQFTKCVAGAICLVNLVTCEPKCKYAVDIKQSSFAIAKSFP